MSSSQNRAESSVVGTQKRPGFNKVLLPPPPPTQSLNKLLLKQEKSSSFSLFRVQEHTLYLSSTKALSPL